MPKKEEEKQNNTAKTEKELLRENNELLHEISKHLKQQRILHTVWMVVKILFLAVPLIAGIIYVPRIVKDVTERIDTYSPEELLKQVQPPQGSELNPEDYTNVQ